MLDLTIFHLAIKRDFVVKYGLVEMIKLEEDYCTRLLDPPRPYKNQNKELIWRHAQLQHAPAVSTIRDYEERINRERNRECNP